MVSILRFLTPKNTVAYIEEDSTVRQGLETMRHHAYTDVPVIDGGGHYVGTLSESDIFGLLLDRGNIDLRYLEETPVRRVLKKDDATVLHNAPIRSLLERVKEHKFVPVVDDRNVFIGIVTRKDVINFFINNYLENEQEV